MSSDFTNNITRLLDAQGVAYQVHRYAYGPDTHSAVAVAEAIGRPPQQVYKSLIAQSAKSSQKPVLVMIPSAASLDLKKLAQAVGEKKMQMAPRADAERLTGMQAGGISPLGLVNRGFRILLDDRAQALEKIVISAGERGAQVELPVEALRTLTRARWVTLAAG